MLCTVIYMYTSKHCVLSTTQCQWQVCMTTVIRLCFYHVWAALWVQWVAININILTSWHLKVKMSVSVRLARYCQDNGTVNFGNGCLLINWTITALIWFNPWTDRVWWGTLDPGLPASFPMTVIYNWVYYVCTLSIGCISNLYHIEAVN